jgi:hypothetical protein
MAIRLPLRVPPVILIAAIVAFVLPLPFLFFDRAGPPDASAIVWRRTVRFVKEKALSVVFSDGSDIRSSFSRSGRMGPFEKNIDHFLIFFRPGKQ